MSEPALQLSVTPDALLDEGLSGARLRGAGPQPDAVWRAKHRDDDGRVWRAIAPTPAGLAGGWVPAKASTGELAAVASLRPLEVEVRVELPDGRALARTVSRRLLADGVRVRRWRDGVVGTLFRPIGEGGFPATVLDATAGPDRVAVAAPAAALLASRGVLCFVVAPPARERDGAAGAAVGGAVELLGGLPAAADGASVVTLDVPPAGADAAALAPAAFVPVPPGIGVRGAGAGPDAAAARAVAWDALLVALGAAPRSA